MYQQLALFRALKNEYERCDQLISHLEHRQQQLPSGYLSCRNGYYYRVVRVGDKRDQIPISRGVPDREALIHELKEQRYISKALPVLKSNRTSYRSLLNGIQLYDPESFKEILPAYYGDFDFTDLLLPGDINPQVWAEESYSSNPFFPKDLKYKSEAGLLTRSKAEADIATMLESNHLLFRYEPLHFGHINSCINTYLRLP